MPWTGATLPARVPPAYAQCLLANPSFEVDGTGMLFQGWNSFGAVTRETTAHHGSESARVEGPGTGSWSTAGVWQRLDSAPGDRWKVSTWVRVDPVRPLAGGSRAIVNVEWHDSADALIDYQSFSAADAGTPVGAWTPLEALSDPAPAGTVSVRLLLAALEAPGGPRPAVTFDEVQFLRESAPSLDALQWEDFPGGREITFAGYRWRVKGDGFFGPGPQWFADDPDNLWVDAAGELHLTVREEASTWYSTEVALVDPLGYGDYRFTVRGALQDFDPRTVLGLFLWQYGPCWDPTQSWWNPYNEMDIEFSRFGDSAAPLGHFTVQPYDLSGNGSAFDPTFGAYEISTHAFRWLPDRVEFRSWRGGPDDESVATRLHAWTYTGAQIARPEQPRVHLNLWSIFGPPATDQESIVADFRFVAAAPSIVTAAPATRPWARWLPARPNPFNPKTELRFELDRAGAVSLVVFDLAGRRVRRLVDGSLDAGRHRRIWDGRDDRGETVGSGVYLARLETRGISVSTRLVLVR